MCNDADALDYLPDLHDRYSVLDLNDAVVVGRSWRPGQEPAVTWGPVSLGRTPSSCPPISVRLP